MNETIFAKFLQNSKVIIMGRKNQVLALALVLTIAVGGTALMNNYVDASTSDVKQSARIDPGKLKAWFSLKGESPNGHSINITGEGPAESVKKIQNALTKYREDGNLKTLMRTVSQSGISEPASAPASTSTSTSTVNTNVVFTKYTEASAMLVTLGAARHFGR